MLVQMTFDGALLKRGFWLYVWRVCHERGEVLYVGRTGDSSSCNASSPFARVGQHLDHRAKAKGNAMARQLKAKGIDPVRAQFSMTAVGPLFEEQKCMEAHRPYRDIMAALEKALAAELTAKGYIVLGEHRSRHKLDAELCAQVMTKLEPFFPPKRN